MIYSFRIEVIQTACPDRQTSGIVKELDLKIKQHLQHRGKGGMRNKETEKGVDKRMTVRKWFGTRKLL